MAEANENAATAAKQVKYPIMTLKGGIGSSNPGEEFVRVDSIDEPGGYGQINRRTGFLAVAQGQSAKLIKAIVDGHLKVQMGSKTRNGVYNVTLIDPLVEGVEVPAGAAAGTEVLLEHTA